MKGIMKGVMKTLFLEAKYKGEIKLNKDITSKLPDKIGLISSLQFTEQLTGIKNQLKNKTVLIEKGKQKYKGQILGCDVSAALKVRGKVDAFLYVGDGEFHPIGVALKTGKVVYQFNPLGNSFKKISEEEINNYKKIRKVALVNFYHAENVGVLICTKPGQKADKILLNKIKNKFEDKKFYNFLFDTLDIRELENFPFVNAWLNTGCPRMEDRKIVNLEDVK